MKSHDDSFSVPRHRHPENGAVVKGLLGFALIILTALLVVGFLFGRVVPPGSMGIRQIAFGPGQGYSREALKPGYQWVIPFYSRIYLIPKTVQILDFARAEDGPDGEAPLEIPTSDRATIDLDLSVLYRFHERSGEKEGVKHGGPADLIAAVGTEAGMWETRVRRVADDMLKRSLGQLSTGEFYDPYLRDEKTKLAQLNMTEALAPYGITIDAVLLRRYTYREERIENAIFQKNLQDQEERVNAADSKLAEAHAALEQVSAEADARIATLRVEGENRANIIRSEGQLYEDEKKAQGDLLVAKARAEVDRLRANALAASAATNVHVAREVAPLLGSMKGGVVSGINPYDLEAWLSRLGVSEGEK